MSEFTRGVVWTVGMYMFGKGMYDLGKQKQQKIHAKEMKKLIDKLQEIANSIDNEEEPN